MIFSGTEVRDHWTEVLQVFHSLFLKNESDASIFPVSGHFTVP